MNKLKTLGILIMLISTTTFAQKGANVKTVSKFKEGTVLSQSDVAFLNLVSNKKVESMRGAEDKSSATLGSTTFTVDQTLSKDDAKMANASIKTFTKTHKGSKTATTLPKSRGNLCWYWYYSCDYYGNCYYYKYYYYCY